MRKPALILAALAAVLTVAPASAREHLSGEQQLAKLIEGRVAGKPSSCIPTYSQSNLRILDHTALVADTGSTIWVNRPDNAQYLDDNDILVTHTFGSELCRLDMVDTVDSAGWFLTGFVALGDFVPYRKQRQAN